MNKSKMNHQENIQKKNSLSSYASLISLGWELAVPIFLGVFIGYRLDQYFGLKYDLAITFLVLGIGVGYYNLYKTVELDYLRTKAAHIRAKKEDNKV